MISKYHLTLILLFTLFGHAFAQSEKIEGKVPPKLLLKSSDHGNYRLSPNGKFFMEVLRENLEYFVVIVDIDAYKVKHKIPMGSVKIHQVNWISNERILYNKNAKVFAIDIDGNNKVELVDDRAEKRVRSYYKYYLNYRFNSILAFVDRDEILVEAFDTEGHSYAKKVNIFTGEKETILDGKKLDVNKWITDKKGNVILGVRYGDDHWEYVRENPNTGEWFPVEINIEGKMYRFRVEGESLLKENILFVDSDYDDEMIYIAANVASDKRELLRYNFKKRYVDEKLLTDVNCDVMDDEGNDIRLLFDSKSKKLGGIRYEGLLPSFQPVSDNFLAIRDSLQQKFPSFVNDIIDYDSDFNRFVIHQWSDVYKGNVGIYDVGKGQYYTMVQLNPQLNNYKLSKTKNISIKLEDGEILSSYLNLPLNYAEVEEVPLVVVPHGGPWARDYWGLEPFSQFFASNGYAVLRVNFRGSTGFGKKHLQAGIRGIGEIMIDDIIKATQHIKESYKIHSDNVFIYGHSYGGYAAYMSLIRYPEIFRAATAVSAPTDIKRLLKLQKKEDKNFSYDFWKFAIGEKGQDAYKQISPVFLADKINAPLLVFHGKNDDIVPIDQAEELEKIFEKKKKKNGTFRTIQFLGHSLEDSNSMAYVLEEAAEFFEKNSKQTQED